MNLRYRVELSEEERQELEALLSGGKHAARKLKQRLEFHYTPKHASWLNMVEIEIGVLHGQCLDRRIGERDFLESEIAEWQRKRNASGARIDWRFTTNKAREKLARLYPVTAKES